MQIGDGGRNATSKRSDNGRVGDPSVSLVPIQGGAESPHLIGGAAASRVPGGGRTSGGSVFLADPLPQRVLAHGRIGAGGAPAPGAVVVAAALGLLLRLSAARLRGGGAAIGL